MKSIVITGVSSGIGRAAALEATKRGFRVFGSVRSPQDGEELRIACPDRFIPLCFDVTDPPAISSAADQVRQQLRGETLYGLVNNAGIAVSGPLLHLTLEKLRLQFEVNVFGVFSVTQAFAPLLGADRSLRGAPGRILNISSDSGENGDPFLGAYSASKHALEGLSESLRREMMLYGIDVIVLGPGAIRTPIWSKADLQPYMATPYAESLRLGYEAMMSIAEAGFPVERCGRWIVDILSAPHPRTRYALIPQPWRNYWPQKLLPKRWIDCLLAKRLKLQRK